ncbi:MAG: isoleucine--tRNA ligase [Candidatus Aenigmatarchaeota archaeon]
MNEEYDPKVIEKEIRQFWRENSIKEKVRKENKGKEKFFLLDGPPYLTGNPHLGHMLNKVVKDTVLRVKRMQGYDAWDQAGFDAHGLPNEVKTEEKLGIEKKTDIGTKISVEKFIEECKKRAVSSENVWKNVMEKLAVWQDFEDPYITFHDSYIESEWWFVKQAAEKDLIYKKKRPMYWCPRCMTSLSQNEISDEYKTIEDHSIFVKFPRKDKENEYFLIWTTTPWTIPGNVAILMHPDFRYARVKTEEGVLIMAKDLVEDVMEKLGIEDYKILNTVDGASLQGKEYVHPLREEVPKHEELDESMNVHRILNSRNLVTLEQGTGCVHTAPGHGEEDYEATRKYELDVFSPVNDEGNFTEEAGKYEGGYVHDTNEDVLDDLRTKGYLIGDTTIEHEYPHCWRCKTKIIQRATKQWYIDVSSLKFDMLEENEKVNWIPGKIRKRFENWLERGKDWCISRQRYWGVPIPIWVCEECGEREVIGSFDELEEKVGELPEDFDPHKPQADEWKWDCDCGGTMERTEDLLDVWCDSGCAPFASTHYPFEEEPFQSLRPMDFIVEGSDQIAKWFYYLMLCSVLAFDEAPSKEVLMHAFVLDEEGKAMSKSLGNVIEPEEIIEKMGTDIPRFWILENSPLWENPKVKLDEIENEGYKIFSVYWNTAQFLEKYRNGKIVRPGKLRPEDRWILSRLEKMVKEGHKRYEDKHFHNFCRKWRDFVLEDLSRWYVKSVRDRARKGDEAALWTLKQCIKKSTLIIAPIVPHVTEKVYRDVLKGERESVHTEEFPEVEKGRINEELEEEMKITRDVVNQIFSLREEEGRKLRWPVKRAVVSTEDEVRDKLRNMEKLIKDMGNVRDLEFGEVETKLETKPDYSNLGPKFKGDAEKVADTIEELTEEEAKELKEKGSLKKQGFEISEDDVKFSRSTSESISGKDFGQGKVFLDMEMTPELEEEAALSELTRDIQLSRKEEGLHVKDKVKLFLNGNKNETLENWKDKLEDRLMVTEIVIGQLQGEKGSFEHGSWKVNYGFKLVDKHAE